MRISTKGKWPLDSKFGLRFLFMLAVLIPSWAMASSSADETRPGTIIAATSGTAVADGVATDTITVTLVDSGDVAVAGVNVDVAVSGGNATLLPSGTQQTDVNGQVILTVSNTVAETVNVTAEFDKNGGTGTDQPVVNGSPAVVVFTAGPPSAANSVISTTDDNAVADGADTNTVDVLVRDANDNPVPSTAVTVALTGTGSASIGTIPTDTDGSGVISIDLTDTTAEALSVGFTVNAVTGSNTTPVTFVVGAPSAANSVISTTDDNAVADGADTNTVEVLVRDANDNPVVSTAVTVALTGTGSASVGTISADTDGSGVISIDLTDSTAEALTVGFTVNAATGSNTTPVTFVAGAPSAANSVISTTDDNAVADGADTNTVEVLVRDANDNPVPSTAVAVALTGTGSASVGTIPTDTDGSGVISIDLTDSTAEALTVGFTVNAATGSNTTPVTFVVGAPSAANSVISTTDDNAVADGADTNTVEVLVRDATNNPVVSTAVTVALTGTGSASIGTIPTDTDGSGVISIDLTDTTAEALTVGFTVNAATGSNTTPVTFVAGAATKLAFGQQPGNTVAGAIIAPAIEVEIQDNFGNLVTSATNNVNLAFDNNPGGLGTLLGTLSKDAIGGVATFDDISVDEIESGYTLGATAGGLANTVSNPFDVTPRAVLRAVISNGAGVDSVLVGTTSTYFVSVVNDGPEDLTIANGGGVFIGINGDEGIDNLHLGNTRAPINDIEGWVELLSGQSVFFPVTGDVIAASQAIVSVTASSPSGVATVTHSDVDSITYPLTYTLNDITYSLECGATFIHQDAGGVVTVSESGCWEDIYPAVPGEDTLVFTRTHEIADRSCPLDVMTMDAMGNITITAQGACIDLDIDNDSIPNEYDPEPNDPTAPIGVVYCTPYIDGNVYLAGNGAVYIEDCTADEGSILIGTGGTQIGDGVNPPDSVTYQAKDAVRTFGSFNVLDGVEFNVETNYSPAP